MKRRSPKRPEDEPGADEARGLALELLARREHSAAELGRKLRRRGVDPEVIDPLLRELAASRLLSDDRFAEAYTRTRIVRGSGPVRIAAELRERGVDEALITRSLDPRVQDWGERVRAARRKRFGPALPAEPRERARQARFLQYRGFTREQIVRVLDEPDPA